MKNHDDINDLPEAPEGLIDGLRAAHEGAPRVPARMDRAILSAARERLSPKRRRVLVLKWAVPLAAAAAVLVAVGVVLPDGDKPALEPAWSVAKVQVPRAREDVDGSGQVDILDAFMLARRIEADDAPADTWDMDGDGAVGQGDVDLIAMAAVRLNGGAVQ